MSARPWPAANWKLYIASSLFRGASIYAGVYHRWTMGNASGGEHARFAGKAGNVMVDCAWDYINRENVLRAHPARGMHVSKAPQQGFHVSLSKKTRFPCRAGRFKFDKWSRQICS